MDIDITVNNDFCREKGRLNGLLLVEGATQAPVIAMLQMANNVRR
ncbi:MAG TPA: hypothetical protein PLL87_04115 [Syntrophorhabdaceae bacterium]|nr:hypothetical protein [Syntrophorhabdaceae bacterium]